MEDDLNIKKMEDDLNIRKIEDNHICFENGRLPIFFKYRRYFNRRCCPRLAGWMGMSLQIGFVI
jgi:hypothetical protein